MTIKSFVIATLLTSAVQVSQAKVPVNDSILRSTDFTHIEEIVQTPGSSVLRLDLTQSGLDKLQARKKVSLELAGKVFSFKVREEILGDQVEVGPFSRTEARRIIEKLDGL